MKVIPFIPEYEAVDTLSEQQQLRQTVEAIHDNTRSAVIQSLESRSKSELIQNYCTEMAAKNKAYYFILENGLLDQFYQFCQCEAG